MSIYERREVDVFGWAKMWRLVMLYFDTESG